MHIEYTTPDNQGVLIKLLGGQTGVRLTDNQLASVISSVEMDVEDSTPDMDLCFVEILSLNVSNVETGKQLYSNEY